MKKITIMILAIACMITVLNSCKDKTGEEVMNTEESEPTTEAPSETEAEIGPTTEPATEVPTEAPTEAPTEPPTEAPTEPEMEFTIKGRETMLEGQPVEFILGFNQKIGPSYYDFMRKHGFKFISIPIMKASVEEQLTFSTNLVETAEQLQQIQNLFATNGQFDNLFTEKDKLEKYNKDFFKDNLIIMLFIYRSSGSLKHTINSVTKNGNELCVSIGANVLDVNHGGFTGDMALWCTIIEIKREFINEVDMISHYVEREE